MSGSKPQSLVSICSMPLLICAPLLLSFLYDLSLRTGDLASGPAMRLALSEKILGGQLPYTQFFSLDTPWLLYLSCLPVKLNEILAGMHMMQPLVPMTKLIIFFLIVVSLLLTLLLLAGRVREQPTNAELRPLLYGLPLALVAGSYFVRFQLGEAQHLFAIFLLPYLIARWLSYTSDANSKSNNTAAMVVGALCALFGSADLLFYFIILLLEAALALTYQRFVGDKFLSSYVITTLLLWATLFLLPPSVQVAFTKWILPLRFAKLLVYDDALSSVNCAPDNRFALCLFAISTVCGMLLKDRLSLLAPLVMLAILGVFTYAIECEGFSSGLILANFACSITLALSFIYLLFIVSEKVKSRKVLLLSLFLLSLSASFLFFQKSGSAIDTALGLPVNIRKNGLPDLQEILNTMSAPGDNVLILSDFANASYPSLVYYDRKQYGFVSYARPLHLFRLLAGAGRLSPTLKEYQKLTREKLLADIESSRAKIIFVHVNHVAEDIALDGLMAALDSRYMLAGRAYYYNQRVEPRESAGGNLPFDYYVLR